jgi:small subunit ribosomal protein S17
LALKSIGIDVAPPQKSCDDVDCPFHGSLATRGKILRGVVASSKMTKTVVVERDILQYVPKYMMYEKIRIRISAHNHPSIEAKEGDKVRIAECRPLSKTVSFVVVGREE